MEICPFCKKEIHLSDSAVATAEGGSAHQECAVKSGEFCGSCQTISTKLKDGLCPSCYKEATCPGCGKLRRELGWEDCEHCGYSQ